jgi:LAO/AO transport system kinase
VGDGIQAAKAGILEVADVLVVNKADRDGADRTVRDLRAALAPAAGDGWRPPVCRTVATREADDGVDAVLEAVAGHRRWLASSGEGAARRARRAAREIEAIALDALRVRMGGLGGPAALGALAEQVVAGRTDPFSAADALLDGL